MDTVEHCPYCKRYTSRAKKIPHYIPKQLVDDYTEAFLTQDDSPKASAALSRRCIQGAIRDFWGLSRQSLFEEIQEIRPKVDATTAAEIASVCRGKIAKHMKGDVNLIVDVDRTEAQTLVRLVETLFRQWYVSRRDRQLSIEDKEQPSDFFICVKCGAKTRTRHGEGGDCRCEQCGGRSAYPQGAKKGEELSPGQENAIRALEDAAE